MGLLLFRVGIEFVTIQRRSWFVTVQSSEWV